MLGIRFCTTAVSLPLVVVWFSISLSRTTAAAAATPPQFPCQLPSTTELVSALNFTAPPDTAGWWSEDYRSASQVQTPFDTTRGTLGTDYLLLKNTISFRRANYSQIWNYHFGSHPVALYELVEFGVQEINLGLNDSRGEVLHHSIDAGTWYAAAVSFTNPNETESGYALLSTQSGPSREQQDIEIADPETLLQEYANISSVVEPLVNPQIFPIMESEIQPTSNVCGGQLPTSSELVTRYNLEPHPEGGYFRETFRSNWTLQTDVGNRTFLTSIYYLMTSTGHSDFHRLRSDETWVFYYGSDKVFLYELDDTVPGGMKTTILGNDLVAGDILQHTLVAGTWFAAEVNPDSQKKIMPEEQSFYGFVGAMVAPGFEFQDWELGVYNELEVEFPQASEKIRQLTPNSNDTTQATAPSLSPSVTTSSSIAAVRVGPFIALAILSIIINLV